MHDLALSHVLKGDYAAAQPLFERLALLELEYEARNPRLPYTNPHPVYEAFRSDPRFQDLLRRMNLLKEVGRPPPG